MGAVQVQHYLNRARDFLKGMESLFEEEVYVLEEDLVQFTHSPALLGIHGAISYCDALRIGLGSESLSSDDHGRAASELLTLLSGRKYEDRQGIQRLERLLAKKSIVAYFPKRVAVKDVHEIVQQARRFAIWAESAGRQLKIEGWRND